MNDSNPPSQASNRGCRTGTQGGLGLAALLEPLNRTLAPVIRLGLGSPLPLTGGVVVLEATGRRSGFARATPLLCADYGHALVVATVRRRSQWVKNLAADPRGHVWLRGRRRAVMARVFQRGALTSPDTQPVTVLSAAARSYSLASGSSVAVLTLI